VLAITVGEDGNENIELVPQKAAAGYLNGYEDPSYLEELPRFRLPNLPVGTYRAFEIKGDSMLPVQPGSIVICEYEDNPNYIKSGHAYIILSRHDGVVYKRVFVNPDQPEALLLRSDNPSYEPYSISLDEVLEVWKAKYLISKLDQDVAQPSIDDMARMMQELRSEVDRLKQKN
jgi:phage repressor protein C with HTH and peptisase S24 domain